MNRLLLSLLIFMLIYNQNVYGKNEPNILIINSIKEIVPHLVGADRNTLVIFDIDSTLTIPSDQYFQRQTINNYKETYKKFINELTENQYYIFLHLVVIDSPSILVEKETLSIIQDLQNNNVNLIGLTASKFGALGDVASFPEWRYQELKKLGIDFIKIFPGKKTFIEFDDLNGEHVGIEKGIIYSGYKNSKGAVLKRTLEELKLYPNQIIIIDDKMANVISVMEASKAMLPKCKVIGFHYKGIELLPKKMTDSKIFEEKILKLFIKAQIMVQ